MPKPHLDRVVDVLRLFAPGARCQQEHSLPRDARRIDVVFGFDELPDFFGPLISPLANRMVVPGTPGTRPTPGTPGTRPEVLA